MMSPAAVFTVTFLPVLTKKAMQSAINIPAKIRNVIDVPTAGIVTNVGTKVPMILPTVLNAPRVPIILPLSSRDSVVYFASEGVTVPRRKRGNTNTIIHVANAAITRKLLLTANITAAEIAIIIYLPRTGIAAIQIAAIRILLYNLSGDGSLSAALPP